MKIHINGNLLYFDIENPGLIPGKTGMRELPVMIVLHGGPGYDHTPYQEFFSALHGTVQILFVDQHGHGRSDPGSAKTWNFARWASDIYELCQTLHIERPIIFGHSFGSMVAMEYAIQYPQHLQKLILCNAVPKFDLKETAKIFYQLGGELAKQTCLNFFENPTDESIKQYGLICSKFYGVQKIDEKAIFYNRLKIKMDILRYFFEKMIKEINFLHRASAIKAHTLILTGEKDPIATVKNANELSEKLGKKCHQNIIVPKTSHNLIWEKTAVVMKHIKEFLL